MADTQGNDNILGAVAYLLGFVTGIVLLLVEKKSKFVRFHAIQSTIFFGLMFVLGFIPLVGFLTTFVSFVFWLVLMWKAFNGQMYKVPYIGDFAEKQLAKMG